MKILASTKPVKILLVLAGVIAISTAPAATIGEAAKKEIPAHIYEWVHSTARQGYFFNKAEIQYAVDSKGFIELNKLIVPTLRIYDDIQIQDVIAKRRWRMQSVDSYMDLTGTAEYLLIDTDKGIVKITARDDLDSDWGTIAHYENVRDIKLAELSEKNAEGIFFRAIIKYASEHQDLVIKHSKGILSDKDKKMLEDAKNPPLPEEKEQDKKKKKKVRNKDKR